MGGGGWQQARTPRAAILIAAVPRRVSSCGPEWRQGPLQIQRGASTQKVANVRDLTPGARQTSGLVTAIPVSFPGAPVQSRRRCTGTGRHAGGSCISLLPICAEIAPRKTQDYRTSCKPSTCRLRLNKQVET